MKKYTGSIKYELGYACYGEVRLGHLFILALWGQVMGRMRQVMKNQSIMFDQGYAYYSEVRLGCLFILALLGQVMGRMCQVMGCMCQVTGHMCWVMKKQSVKYYQGYAYYGQVRLGNLFYLGRMVMGRMCQVMKKQSIKTWIQYFLMFYVTDKKITKGFVQLVGSTLGCGRSNLDSIPGILPSIVSKVKTSRTVKGTLRSKRGGELLRIVLTPVICDIFQKL